MKAKSDLIFMGLLIAAMFFSGCMGSSTPPTPRNNDTINGVWRAQMDEYDLRIQFNPDGTLIRYGSNGKTIVDNCGVWKSIDNNKYSLFVTEDETWIYDPSYDAIQHDKSPTALRDQTGSKIMWIFFQVFQSI